MSMQKLVEARMQEMKQSGKIMVERFKKYMGAIDKSREKKGLGPLSFYEKVQVAQGLQNAFDNACGTGFLSEATDRSAVEFLPVQMSVISALMPSLVMNEIGVVQTLERRDGSVFYFNFKYDQAKGDIAQGDIMHGAKTGVNRSLAGRRYAANVVENELIGAAGSTTYTGTVAYPSVVANETGVQVLVPFTITNGVESFVDNGEGVLVATSSTGTNGTITYATGEYSVTFETASASAVVADYMYDYEKIANGAGVPKVTIGMETSPIKAIDFPLQVEYTLGAQIDLKKAHGIDLESEFIRVLTAQIKFEIDHFGIDQIAAVAKNASGAYDPADAIGEWVATPSASQEWVWRKYEFLDRIEKGNENIVQKTLRGNASYIIAGPKVQRIIRQLGDNFKPVAGLSTRQQTGPIVIGNLDGRPVIYDPMVTKGEYYMGFKGSDFLSSSFVYAPYIPLFMTPTLVKGNLTAEKGFLSSSGFKSVNDGMFTYGSVSGLD